MNVKKHTVFVKGDVPGEKSLDLLERQTKYESTAVTYPKNIPIAIKEAYGPYIVDEDGNKYFDFLTGAGVLCLGHAHPELVKAACSQISQLSHGLDFPTKVKSEFTAALLNVLPDQLQSKMRVHFSGPSGADAVETAIKIARSHTKNNHIISFQGSYHGSTALTMGITGYRGAKLKQPVSIQDVSFFPFPYCYRCPLGLERSTCKVNCITYLENALNDTHSGLSKPAAVIIEPVQGEGGSIPARKEFLKHLADILKRSGILLIVDEVQTGIGRTGTWFAFEQFDIEPDIIVSSKALSGIGQPISTVLYNRSLSWEKGAHIGTFRGNQVAMASGIEMFRIIEEQKVLSNVRDVSEIAIEYLKKSLHGVDFIGEIRGLGLMLGVEVINPRTGQACSITAKRIQSTALRKGLVVELGGRGDGVIRILPPLNITRSQMEEALNILCSAIIEQNKNNEEYNRRA